MHDPYIEGMLWAPSLLYLWLKQQKTATKIQKSLQLVQSNPSDINLYAGKGTESP